MSGTAIISLALTGNPLNRSFDAQTVSPAASPQLSMLVLSGTGISGPYISVLSYFWRAFPNLSKLDLSSNQISSPTDSGGVSFPPKTFPRLIELNLGRHHWLCCALLPHC